MCIGAQNRLFKLAFAAYKGQKYSVYKPLKHLDGLEIQSLSINIKMFKNPSQKGNFCLAFMADEGRKGQNLVLAT